MKIKTSDLTEWPLRYAVAISEGLGDEVTWMLSEVDSGRMCMWTDNHGCYDPDRDWDIGGPMIEKYRVWLSPPADQVEPFGWDSEIYGEDDGAPIADQDGCETALIAVCRAVVQSKIGDEVDIPDDLLLKIKESTITHQK